MWALEAALGLVVVAGLGLVLVGLGRVLPPGRAKELVSFVPHCIVLLSRLRADRRLPLRARLALLAALAYLVSPVQLVPNVIPVLGQSDDLAVVILSLRYACRRLPRADVEAAWPGNPAHLDRLLGRPARCPLLQPGPERAAKPGPGILPTGHGTQPWTAGEDHHGETKEPRGTHFRPARAARPGAALPD